MSFGGPAFARRERYVSRGIVMWKTIHGLRVQSRREDTKVLHRRLVSRKNSQSVPAKRVNGVDCAAHSTVFDSRTVFAMGKHSSISRIVEFGSPRYCQSWHHNEGAVERFASIRPLETKLLSMGLKPFGAGGTVW
jgi:hypothetical protein